MNQQRRNAKPKQMERHPSGKKKMGVRQNSPAWTECQSNPLALFEVYVWTSCCSCPGSNGETGRLLCPQSCPKTNLKRSLFQDCSHGSYRRKYRGHCMPHASIAPVTQLGETLQNGKATGGLIPNLRCVICSKLPAIPATHRRQEFAADGTRTLWRA